LGYGISGMPGIPVDPTGSAHFGTWKASIGFTSSVLQPLHSLEARPIRTCEKKKLSDR
jgi:hypothetical protein